MSDFETALQQVRDEETVTAATPAPETTPAGNEGQPATPPANDEHDLPADIKAYLDQNPDHRPIVEQLDRQFKAAFTPRLQEAAELRKQFEGIDVQTAQAIRQLQQMMQTDPARAAEYLRQQAILLEGAQNPTVEPTIPNTEPEFELDPATEVEAVLMREVREIREWQKQQAQWLEQQKQQQEQVRMQQKAISVQSEFSKLEQEFGIQVPIEQRAQAWEAAEKLGVSVTDAYFALNRSTLLPNLIQKAKDEASSVVHQKVGQAAGNPGNLAMRAPGSIQTDGSFDSFLQEVLGGGT